MPHDFRTCDCDSKARRLVELSSKMEKTPVECHEIEFLQYCLDKDRVCV
jgi:hypothetical protein